MKPKISIESVLNQLLQVARSTPPSSDAPPGFEKRVMAAIQPSAIPEPWALWNRFLWQACAPCAAIMIGAGLVAWFHNPATAPPEPLSVALDYTILAAVETPAQIW